jgi:hypothetical protein
MSRCPRGLASSHPFQAHLEILGCLLEVVAQPLDLADLSPLTILEP